MENVCLREYREIQFRVIVLEFLDGEVDIDSKFWKKRFDLKGLGYASSVMAVIYLSMNLHARFLTFVGR